ncbi:acetolactate synthase small subunit [Corynebacterium caspium]|uniref:acetolactate synthase small subunit n=1 Tax=Corynebacterium caspium TaxID=234828 RepID=UPI000372B2FE|nr:acetolactate synthase small subunit [Corynebacterium caspium]WKD59414.1 Putative acetolactate synthase small subunit [Corynebacterium caspium DSM 44850]
MDIEKKAQILSVLVQDGDGVVARVIGMFARRGFSIVSLVTASTEVEGIKRLTIVVDADEVVTEQITKQLNKIVSVLKVVRLEAESTVARATMLVKVNVNNVSRPQVIAAADIFRARIVDVAPDSLVVEATGVDAKLHALLDVLEPFGIRELAQSGVIALNRGPKTMAPTRN